MRTTHIKSIVFSSSFFFILLLPLIGMFLSIPDTASCENRKLEEFPKFETSKAYLQKLETYFNDHYGFRNTLTSINARLKVFVFNSSPKSDITIIGKNDWYFYTNKNDHILSSYSHKNLFTPDELESYHYNLSKIQQTLNAKNIHFSIVIWPNKSTIYNEFTPFQLRIQQKDTLSKLDQLVQYVKKVPTLFTFIDGREGLIKEKNKYQLYSKHDTHWNDYGAFLGYRYFFEITQLGITPFQLSDFTIKEKTTNSGDLINAMGICNTTFIKELQPEFIFKDTTIKPIFNENGPYDFSSFSLTSTAKNDQKVLIFCDSYTIALKQFFSLHFKEVHYAGTNYDQKIVDEIKPSIVIISKVERFL